MSLMIELKLCLLLLVHLVCCSTNQNKPELNFEEFFDYTQFPTLSFSPTHEHLLFQTRRTDWNASVSDDHVWLYEIATQRKKLITRSVNGFEKLQWSPSGNHIAFFRTDPTRKANYMFLYSVASDVLLSLPIDIGIPTVWKWSSNDTSLYLAITQPRATENQATDREEWRDVIQYRESLNVSVSTILRIEFDMGDTTSPVQIHPVTNLNFLIADLLFVPNAQKLIMTSKTPLIEHVADFEIYSLDLRNPSVVSRLTQNQAFEVQLELSRDGEYVLFRENHRREAYEGYNHTQHCLYSLNLTSRQIERWAKDFHGHITQHMATFDGGVLFFGQVGTETHLYTQRTPNEPSIKRQGWQGTYEKVAFACTGTCPIAFVFSSLERPKEIYLTKDIDQLTTAHSITSENELLTRRDLPRARVYRWKNEVDSDTIEGILHYPPGQFEAKNLPLFVLMHGGPYGASLNSFEADWYNWATLAALNGWLVLEPNFCGSTGYGDEFVNEIRRQTLSRPGRDVLAGVDRLVGEGIADPDRLTVGGYSFGGLLANWLITQTTRFNAALSGSGTVAQVSAWGTTDLPLLFTHLFGGFPWNEPDIFHNQSVIYQLDRVRTPTLIVTGENDVRVHTSQSYILERSLHYLGVPVRLLVFPTEGHDLENDPWHGRIKVREELKWLKKYGHHPRIPQT